MFERCMLALPKTLGGAGGPSGTGKERGRSAQGQGLGVEQWQQLGHGTGVGE